MATLAELRARASNGARRSVPTHVKRITLEQELLADVERLETERNDLLIQANREDSEGNQTGPPRKSGEKATPPRVEEIAAELTSLYDRIRETEGELLLRGMTGGEWQRYKDEHPPREDSKSDEITGWGWVNATDLLNDLGRFVVAWNGEEFADGDWLWFREQVAPGDLRELVTAVVAMHERSGVRVPKSSSASSSTETSATD